MKGGEVESLIWGWETEIQNPKVKKGERKGKIWRRGDKRMRRRGGFVNGGKKVKREERERCKI